MDQGYAVAFSMYPTTVDQLMAIADAGQIMPPKSTWFAKLHTGLLSRTSSTQATPCRRACPTVVSPPPAARHYGEPRETTVEAGTPAHRARAPSAEPRRVLCDAAAAFLILGDTYARLPVFAPSPTVRRCRRRTPASHSALPKRRPAWACDMWWSLPSRAMTCPMAARRILPPPSTRARAPRRGG